jgi:hypothetical protein
MRRTEKTRNKKKRRRRMLTGRISSPYIQISEGHLEQTLSWVSSYTFNDLKKDSGTLPCFGSG